MLGFDLMVFDYFLVGDEGQRRGGKKKKKKMYLEGQRLGDRVGDTW